MTLKDLRESVGMTQHDVARKLDVTDVAISRWECGRSSPLYKYRERMADLYGVSVDEVNATLPKAAKGRRGAGRGSKRADVPTDELFQRASEQNNA